MPWSKKLNKKSSEIPMIVFKLPNGTEEVCVNGKLVARNKVVVKPKKKSV